MDEVHKQYIIRLIHKLKKHHLITIFNDKKKELENIETKIVNNVIISTEKCKNEIFGLFDPNKNHQINNVDITKAIFKELQEFCKNKLNKIPKNLFEDWVLKVKKKYDSLNKSLSTPSSDLIENKQTRIKLSLSS